jgi:hypothetical protein
MVDARLTQTICPFMRTMLTAPDPPQWNSDKEEMEVSDLVGFVRKQGGSGDLDRVLRFFAVFNHGLGDRDDRIANLDFGSGGRFSTRLTGSDGDHKGGSLIYNKTSGEFDENQFRLFTGFSSDGETMSVGDLGKAIVNANSRHDGALLDAGKSAGEFALLSVLLGDDKGTIAIKDMELLFKENKFPERARVNLGRRTTQAGAVSAEAIRIGLHHAEMQVQTLTDRVKGLFSSLID